ncbi:MAG: TonB C-terminal domain-containing protein [Gammaproteobacteria bacterium]|nr:TonB C-terminal domain-containing protein [Gammaproteobacteria bacterium]
MSRSAGMNGPVKPGKPARLNALFGRALRSLRQAAGSRSPGGNPNNPPLPLLKPWSYSISGHVLAAALMLIGFAGRIQPEVPAFGTVAIDGVVLDDEAVREEIQRLDDMERAAVIEREQEMERLRREIDEQEARSRRQQQELSSLSSQAEEARRALSEQQTQATRQLGEMQQRQQQERERLERIEREREAEEARAAAAEAERRKAEEEARQLAERAEEAQRQLDEAARRRREAEVAEQVRREMEAERRRGMIESGLLDEYRARIRQRIESNWTRPASTREDLMWVVLLDMLPGNEIADIRFEQFNGTETDRRSIEAAIRRSSPLPAPPEPELFERQLRLRYPPSESGG